MASIPSSTFHHADRHQIEALVSGDIQNLDELIQIRARMDSAPFLDTTVRTRPSERRTLKLNTATLTVLNDQNR